MNVPALNTCVCSWVTCNITLQLWQFHQRIWSAGPLNWWYCSLLWGYSCVILSVRVWQEPRAFALQVFRKQQELSKQMTLCELRPREVEISTNLTVGLSPVFFPVLTWPGNLLRDKWSLLPSSLLNLSLSCHWLLLQGLFIWNFLLICLLSSLQGLFCDRDAFNQGLLEVSFIILLWLARPFGCSKQNKKSQMLGLMILYNSVFERPI